MSALNLNLEYTTEAVLKLKAAYEQLPWYKRIFFPHRLGNALTQMSHAEPTHEQLLSVHTTYNHRINFIAKRIFTCLKVFSKTLKLLKSTHLKDAIVENVQFNPSVRVLQTLVYPKIRLLKLFIMPG